jgi:hypothetical protein
MQDGSQQLVLVIFTFAIRARILAWKELIVKAKPGYHTQTGQTRLFQVNRVVTEESSLK